MRILVSIVSHNQQDLVKSSLSSFDRFATSKLHEVVFVVTENTPAINNASSKNFKVIKINNLRQKGFGENHNVTFERVKSDFFIIANPDIVLTKNFDFDLLIDAFEKYHIDIGSPIVFNTFGEVEDFKRSDLKISNILKRKVFKMKERFDWLAGMFLIVRSESFFKLNGFDTDFFMYVEDCDLSMRARKLGMKLSELVDFSVVHNARRTSRKNLKYFKWHLTSLIRYLIFKRN